MPSALGTFPDFVMLGPLLLITGEKGSVREEVWRGKWGGKGLEWWNGGGLRTGRRV